MTDDGTRLDVRSRACELRHNVRPRASDARPPHGTNGVYVRSRVRPSKLATESRLRDARTGRTPLTAADELDEDVER